MSTVAVNVALRPPRPRQLWHIPLFLLGLAAVLSVPYLRPLWRVDGATRYAHDLDTLRLGLEAQPADLGGLAPIAERVRVQAERFPGTVSRARLLLGTFRIAQADALGATTPEAKDYWSAAKADLEALDPLLLSASERNRLMFRLGKVLAYTGADPRLVIDKLKAGADVADSAAELNALLAEFYQKLPKPDRPAALAAVQAQLARMPAHTPPTELARTRLTQARLHLQLKQAGEARKVLENITPEAPVEVYVQARTFMAQSLIDEDQAWNDAARQLSLALARLQTDADKLPKEAEVPALAELQLKLGQCYQKAGRPREATETWTAAQKTPGPAAQAATFRLAALKLKTDDRRAAVKDLDDALVNVTGPDQFTNPYLTLAEVRDLFEQAASVLVTHQAFDEARKVALLYGRISKPGRDRVVAAEAADAQGTALRQQAKTATGVSAHELEQQARQAFQQAALEYQTLALQSSAPQGPTHWRRRAADDFVRAVEPVRALELYETIANAPDCPDDQRGEVWYLVGQLHRQLKDPTKAQAAYKQALQRPGPFVAKARLELALLRSANNDPVGARQDLEANLEAPYSGDLPVFERSLSALADLLFHQRDYRAAENVYLQALKHFPDGPNTLNARFQLGRCAWCLALEKSQQLQNPALSKEARETLQKQLNELLRAVAKRCKDIEADLRTREVSLRTLTPPGQLAPTESLILRQASFSVAEAHFYLAEYDEAARFYEIIAHRYTGAVAELVALHQLWGIYAQYLPQPDKMQASYERFRAALSKIPDSAFDGSAPEFQRTFWTAKLTEMAKTAK
jgi:tetratricopeptide (TPR) repeat protein